MEITINGDTREVEEGLSLTRLLEQFGIGGERNLAIEHNGEFLDPEADWDSVTIGQGDTLEIVHFVGGG
jgi:thiamine biosynthesis protein ThiS